MDKREYRRLLKYFFSQIYSDPRRVVKEARAFVREAKKNRDPEREAFGCFIIGVGLFYSGIEVGMLENMLKADAYYSVSGVEPDMALRSKGVLAAAYATVGDHVNAIKANCEELELARKMRKRGLNSTTYNNMAMSYYELGEANMALRILKREYGAESRRKKPHHPILRTLAYNIADISLKEGSMEQAEAYFEKTREHYDLCSAEKRAHDEAMMKCFETRLCYEKGENERANLLADEVFRLIEDGKGSFEFNGDYEKIALYQIALGEYDRADKFADYLWEYSEKTKRSNDIVRAARLQATYFEKVGEPERAMVFYRKMAVESENWAKAQRRLQYKSVRAVETVNAQIAKMRREMEVKEILASRDPLTKLLNRSALSRLTEKSIEEAKEKNIKLGCIFLDVDNFKVYNDRYGHLTGDEVLKCLGDVFLSVETEKFHIARYGGDEFFGVMTGYTDEEVKEFARAIARAIREIRITCDGEDVPPITVSIGLTNRKLGRDDTIMDVVSNCDATMYYSKEAGKNCICMYDPHAAEDDVEKKFIRVAV